MVELGYSLLGEEHPPDDLVETARRAEEAGFEFAIASDHFHPWLRRQGNASFLWSTLGGVARETTSLRVGTGVVCPLYRIHPAIVAQAAASVATMLPGRFFLGVGTGEYLNEHVLGDHWPPHDVRLDRLEEAVGVIRELWTGEEVTHRGDQFTVENAQLFTLPDDTPPIHVAASGSQAAESAGRIGDGLVSTAPDEEVIEAFAAAGDGENRPRYGQVTVCWADTEDEARETAHEHWSNTALSGELGQVLPTPAHFEQATALVTPDDVAERVVCGPDPDDHVEEIQSFADAGFDHVTVHQIGPEQDACIEFYEENVLPAFD